MDKTLNISASSTQPKWDYRHVALLMLIAVVCLWPFSFGVFSAKNDNIIQFLPTRFHVSEALRHGHLPLWTPYMYLGYPLHGDMQGGAWNPVVWLLSIFGRYDLTSLHIEVILATITAGLGMYRLLGTQALPSLLRFAGAAAYMMCGYVLDVSGSNLPFLWAGALVPFFFAYYYEFLREVNLRYAIAVAVSVVLMLTNAYPSFLILSAYVAVAALVIKLVRRRGPDKAAFIKKIFSYHLLCLALVLVLGAPVIYSYLHILPHYARVHGVSIDEALANSFTPGCLSSFIFPSAPVKMASTAATDLISRNIYCSIVLLSATLYYVTRSTSAKLNWMMIGALFFLLFSLGTELPLREYCYRVLPLMNTFRHPSNARLFVIIAIIFTGITTLANSFSERGKQERFARVVPMLLLSGIILFLVISLFQRDASFARGNAGKGFFSRDGLKALFTDMKLPVLLLITGLIQVCTLLFYTRWVREKRLWLVSALIVLNSFVMAQLSLPFTLASRVSPATINAQLHAVPTGFPLPSLIGSIGAHSADSLRGFDTIGINTFYNKEIATTKKYFTPTFMNAMLNLNADSAAWSNVMRHPFAYLGSGDGVRSSIKIQKFWNNGFGFDVMANEDSEFHLQQLYLPGWVCVIDDEAVAIHAADRAMMAVSMPAGHHKVLFQYRPRWMLPLFLLSPAALLVIIFFLIKRGRHA